MSSESLQVILNISHFLTDRMQCIISTQQCSPNSQIPHLCVLYHASLVYAKVISFPAHITTVLILYMHPFQHILIYSPTHPLLPEQSSNSNPNKALQVLSLCSQGKDRAPSKACEPLHGVMLRCAKLFTSHPSIWPLFSSLSLPCSLLPQDLGMCYCLYLGCGYLSLLIVSLY